MSLNRRWLERVKVLIAMDEVKKRERFRKDVWKVREACA